MQGFLSLFSDLGDLIRGFFSWLRRIWDALVGLDDKEILGIMDKMIYAKNNTEGMFSITFTQRKTKVEMKFAEKNKKEEH